MSPVLPEIFRGALGGAVGLLIGVAFGLLQQLALRRNERRESERALKSGWSLMPGAGARVAYLLVALTGVQLVCPLLFVGEAQWWVSGGVALGYSGVLWRGLRRRLAEAQGR